MKKIFTLATVVLATLSANAQQLQVGFINEDLVGWNVDGEGKKTSKTTSIAADTELAKTADVTMYNAYTVDYKNVSVTADADIANTITINGTEVAISEHGGMQGQTNPAPNSIGTWTTETQDGINFSYFQGGQTSGAVLKFDVRADGILFVFHKATYNKNYFAWFGEANLGKGILMAVRHAGMPVKEANGSHYDYTMPEDENGMGFAADEGITSVIQVQKTVLVDGEVKKVWLDANGNEVYDESQAAKDDAGKSVQAKVSQTSLKQLYELLPADNFKTGNALSVIALPVYEGKWFVNACGSKITTNGFAFLPTDDISSDNLKAITIAFSKSGETAVAGVAEAKSEVAAPVKVLGANGIQIGNYNIAGQRVK